MTDMAKEAVEAAIQIEGLKHGLRQNQSGDWTLSFTIAGADMPIDITTAPMGQRFMIVLVMLDTNEEPLPRQKKREFRDLLPSAQIALLCKDARFIAFLREEFGLPFNHGEHEAIQLIRFRCKVKSRTELDVSEGLAKEWHRISDRFFAWKLAG